MLPSTNDTQGSQSKWRSKQCKIIACVSVFVLLALIISLTLAFTVFAAEEGSAPVTVQETTTEVITRTVRTNATAINVTETMLVNASCVNSTMMVDNEEVTVRNCTNATYVNVTKTVTTAPMFMEVTELVETVEELTYSWWNGRGSWEYAVNGFDVVAYFSLDSNSGATAGSDDYVSTVYGVKWRFASQANKDLFDADPAQYVPKYGGHCAFAMRGGTRTTGAPDAWTVYQGALYLNANTNVRGSWLSGNLDGNIQSANDQWSDLLEANGWSNPH